MINSSPTENFKEDINFYINTTYKGIDIKLNIIANHGLYSIIHNDKPIGHIKVGNVRHTWYVVDSNYTPPCLVDEIGNKITALLNAA
jgi:hypothetical protein